jgi:hypothetical protein
LARVESGKGHGLTGIAEAPRSGIESQQNGEGALPKAGDTIEQALLVAQGRIVVDVITDGLNDPLNLLVPPLEMLGDPFLEGTAMTTGTVPGASSVALRAPCNAPGTTP